LFDCQTNELFKFVGSHFSNDLRHNLPYRFPIGKDLADSLQSAACDLDLPPVRQARRRQAASGGRSTEYAGQRTLVLARPTTGAIL
jgi:hypothetical protein